MRVYALLIPQEAAKRLGRAFWPLGSYLAEYTPELKSDIVMASIDMSAEEYLTASIASSAVIGLFMFWFTYLPLVALELAPGSELWLAAAPAVTVAALDFIVLLRYPRILAVKRAEIVEKDLVYALKDLMLNLSAGLPLFDSIRRVSEAEHGIVSADMKDVVDDTNRGTPLDEALESLALKSSSNFMRNALWQTINAVKSGTSVKEALSSIVDALVREQRRKIQNYIQELNVLTLIYMLFAVAVPTIISTVLVVLTSLMGTSITEEIYIFVIIICVMIQVGLVGLIRSRRPLVYSA